MKLIKKANINKKYMCVLIFSLFCLGQTEEWTESEGGKERECWTVSEGSIPAITADVKSSASYRKRRFQFTKLSAIFRACLFCFSFEVGVGTDVYVWGEASAVD